MPNSVGSLVLLNFQAKSVFAIFAKRPNLMSLKISTHFQLVDSYKFLFALVAQCTHVLKFANLQV